MAIVLLVFFLQVVTALIVVFFLIRHLNNELINLAIESFETLKVKGDSPQIKDILVTSACDLDQKIISRVKSVAFKRFKEIPISFGVNPALQGGLVIIFGDEVIDCSLKTRVR
ncbi:MAG: F0F1 ATP synthase subunit delta [Candidatus Omnitrophica bacterium]|nr:F0F1 ATP synthase subunit delta [Candidatus Omnitrophota bacterium]